MTVLCDKVFWEGVVPSDWELSTLVPLFKGKGDPVEGLLPSNKAVGAWYKSVRKGFGEEVERSCYYDMQSVSYDSSIG